MNDLLAALSARFPRRSPFTATNSFPPPAQYTHPKRDFQSKRRPCRNSAYGPLGEDQERPEGQILWGDEVGRGGGVWEKGFSLYFFQVIRPEGDPEDREAPLPFGRGLTKAYGYQEP